MMKRLLMTVCAMLLVPAFIMAQNDLQSNWDFEGVFPDSSVIGALQGITTTPNDEVWVQYWSLNGISQFVIYDFNGVALDTIQSATVNDEVFQFGANQSRGATTAPDGNVVASFGNRIIIFDYETREAITWFFPNGEAAGPVSAPSVSDDGFILTSHILSSEPIQIFDSELNQINVITPEKIGVSRYSVISPDGNWVFDFPLNEDDYSIRAWHSTFGPEGEYELVSDNFGARFNVQSAAIDRLTGHLIVSSGNNAEPPHDEDYDMLTWFFLDYENEEFVDYVKWELTVDTDTSEVAPRGVATSWDGEYIFLASFDFGHMPSIQKFKRRAVTSIENDLRAETPEGYSLDQNYPNPFNPTTQITFSIPNAGMTSLRVYDMLGREVATLLNESMGAGSHTVTFDAINLTSGMYVYFLEANGVRLSRKMMLVK